MGSKIVVRKLGSLLITLVSSCRSRILRLWLTVFQEGVRLDSSSQFAKGVVIRATDGGRATFGRDCSIDRNATILIKHGRLSVGPACHIGIGAVIVARESIRIGKGVLIGEYVSIRDQDHVFGGKAPTANSGFTTLPIVIGNNVWLGAKATVTKGVTIGDNTVIGANSVVTRDIPANVLAAGVPARVIRELQLGDRSNEASK